MVSRLSALLIWALVAAAAVFWSMRLLVRSEPAPTNAVVVGDASQLRGDFSRLLGAEPVAAAAVAPQASSRFRLLGVMAEKAGPQGAGPGVALISIDGKPPRAFSAGASVDEQLVLQTVSLRSASLGPAQGAATLVLEIPALPPPATGSLPGAAPVRQAVAPARPTIPMPAAAVPRAPNRPGPGNSAR